MPWLLLLLPVRLLLALIGADELRHALVWLDLLPAIIALLSVATSRGARWEIVQFSLTGPSSADLRRAEVHRRAGPTDNRTDVRGSTRVGVANRNGIYDLQFAKREIFQSASRSEKFGRVRQRGKLLRNLATIWRGKVGSRNSAAAAHLQPWAAGESRRALRPGSPPPGGRTHAHEG